MNVYSHLITPSLPLAVFRLGENVLVYDYQSITTKWLNFVQTQLDQANADSLVVEYWNREKQG
ncbi:MULTISPECIES: hypothetical protein [sulfur-oxidizing symbionts]|uniref:hypothetical protein n=1 Tax=sulfur-oxidizing symbionts TaxID=32036 RepID=UPI00192B70CC|nr:MULTISPECIES: hypothetical protein [sulfur-oxidizing symbionts]